MKTLNELGHDVRSAQAAADAIEENICAAEKARKEAQEAAEAAIGSLRDDLARARESHSSAITALQDATDRIKSGDYGESVPEAQAVTPAIVSIFEDDDAIFEGVNRTEAGDWAGI
jgi:chromosome segregation ATPase